MASMARLSRGQRRRRLATTWSVSFERLVMFGVPVASMVGAWRLLNRAEQGVSPAADQAEDVARRVRDREKVRSVLGAGLAMLFVYLHLELNRTSLYLHAPVRAPVLTFLWLAMCLFLLLEYRARPDKIVLGILMVFVTGLVVKLFGFDMAEWGLRESLVGLNDFRCPQGYVFEGAAMRLLDFAAIILFLGFGFRVLGGDAAARDARSAFGWTALALLFVYLTFEMNTFLFEYVPGLRAGGISILWTLFALGLVLAGILRAVGPLRHLGLGLLAVVIGKVFFIDLAHLEQVYRIVAFLVLGVLVLSGSFIYLKYRHVFVLGPATSPGDAIDRKEQ